MLDSSRGSAARFSSFLRLSDQCANRDLRDTVQRPADQLLELTLCSHGGKNAGQTFKRPSGTANATGD